MHPDKLTAVYYHHGKGLEVKSSFLIKAMQNSNAACTKSVASKLAAPMLQPRSDKLDCMHATAKLHILYCMTT